MDRSDQTAVAGIVIGACLAVATLTVPWEIPIAFRHVLFWFGAFGTIAGIWWLVDAHALSRSRRTIRRLVPATAGFLFIVAVVGTEWPHQNKQANQLDYAISLQCNPSRKPTHSRQDRPILIVQITQPLEGIRSPEESINQVFQVQGDYDLKWDIVPDWISRCTLSNYSQTAVRNISGKFLVDWRRVIKTENNGTRSGDVLTSAAFSLRPLILELLIIKKNTFMYTILVCHSYSSQYQTLYL